MPQPVRKTIQETHKELIQEPYFKTLIVDGNSLLFHCMKDDKVNNNNCHYGGIFQFLLQLRMQLTKGEFEYVYVTFDDKYSGILKYQVYPYYKANRDKDYASYVQSEYMKAYNENLKRMQKYLFDKNKKETKDKSDYEKFIDENFDRERDRLCLYFNELFIRWQMDEVTEGDDLISYYCHHKKKNEKIVIVTGDMDLSQLLTDDICIYNLNNKKYITHQNFKSYFGMPSENILVKKILCGDYSDNISNISGLSEKGLCELIPEIKEKPITVEDVKKRAQELIDERVKNKKKPLKVHENIVNGISNKEYDGDFYEINEKIINLNKPLLSDEAINEIEATMYSPMDPDGRSIKNLVQLIEEDGIVDLMGDTRFASFFAPFKSLIDKEKKKYEIWCQNQ